MRMLIGLVAALMLSGLSRPASAQTADEIVEKSIAALGGRAAHAKITSRSMIGTILLSTPAGEIPGQIEVLNAVPNKSRSLIKADLTSLGAGQLVLDQRFNGTSGYVLDSLQGNREITGGQLNNLRNGAFPHPFLAYKDMGTTVQLSGKESVGGKDMFLLIFTPKAGSTIRQYIDAQTFLPTRTITRIEVPQLGQEVEQTTEFLDYRDVDGIKVPFQIKSSSSVQNFTVTLSSVHHNIEVDETLFSKPAGQ